MSYDVRISKVLISTTSKLQDNSMISTTSRFAMRTSYNYASNTM